MLYIALMHAIVRETSDARYAASTDARREPVSDVNAHLRTIPRDLSDFRVVVTFHRSDGSLCEAELKPAEAAGLMSEILCVINQGNGGAHRRRAALGRISCDG